MLSIIQIKIIVKFINNINRKVTSQKENETLKKTSQTNFGKTARIQATLNNGILTNNVLENSRN